MCRPISKNPASELRTITISGDSTMLMKKRVSFDAKIVVHVVPRMDPFAVRECFYKPSDFRRFRSEACLEILEARATREPWKTILKGILSRLTPQSQQPQQIDFSSYQYYQAFPHCGGSDQLQLTTSSCKADLSSNYQQRQISPESLVRELAFAI